MLYLKDNLTDRERMARDEMIHIFNPVLKLILAHSNPVEFERYGFNSCRQTAIFGTAILSELLPEYNFKLYEGQFAELYNGQMITYTHAFTIGQYQDRMLLIDISRVSKRLLFHQIEDTLYPCEDEWKNVSLINKEELSLAEMLTSGVVEYFTGKSPMSVLLSIKTLMEELKENPEQYIMQFCDKMYGKYTQLRR